MPNAVGFRLARNRRRLKRPPEPRPSGVHPEEDAVGKAGVAFRLRMLERFELGGGLHKLSAEVRKASKRTSQIELTPFS